MTDQPRLFSVILFLFSGILFVSCSRHVAPKGSAQTAGARIPSPPCIVYRMRADYSRNVPVILSADRSSITSYPDIKDVWYNGKLAYPTPLVNGYYLDNRGIGPGVAFLDYTYDEYSKLGSTPPASELMKHILAKDPLEEMYQCGLRGQYTDIEKELVAIISSGKLNSYPKLK